MTKIIEKPKLTIKEAFEKLDNINQTKKGWTYQADSENDNNSNVTKKYKTRKKKN